MKKAFPILLFAYKSEKGYDFILSVLAWLAYMGICFGILIGSWFLHERTIKKGKAIKSYGHYTTVWSLLMYLSGLFILIGMLGIFGVFR